MARFIAAGRIRWAKPGGVQSAAFAALLGVVTATAASAATIVTTITGTVPNSNELLANTPYAPPLTANVDTLGVFDGSHPNLAGQSFSIVYTTDDTTPGSIYGYNPPGSPYPAMPPGVPPGASAVSFGTTAEVTIGAYDFSIPTPDSLYLVYNGSTNYNGTNGVVVLTGVTVGNLFYGVSSSIYSETDTIPPSYLYYIPFSHITQPDDVVPISAFAHQNVFSVFDIAHQSYLEAIELPIASITVAVSGPILPPPPPPPPPATVPEPGTWVMLLLGAGLTGLALRRRRARRSVPGLAAT